MTFKHEVLSEGIEIYCGDCLEVLPTLIDVDAVITDPPYGNGTEYGVYDDSTDNLRGLVSAFMPLVFNVSKSVFITSGVANMWLYPQPTWVLCWANRAGVGSSKWGFCCWQPILAYGDDPFLQDGKGRRPDLFLQVRSDAAKVAHPCPKPTDVMCWIFERCTRCGDRALDPFMGSGTTGVAAIKTGRRFIGIEIDEGYYEIAKRRILDELAKPRMF